MQLQFKLYIVITQLFKNINFDSLDNYTTFNRGIKIFFKELSIITYDKENINFAKIILTLIEKPLFKRFLIKISNTNI